MAFDYPAMRDTADQLINDFGVAVTLKRNTRAAYDPQNQTATLSASTEFGFGVLYPIDMEMVKDTDIRATDLTCLMSAKKTDGTLLSLPVQGDAIIVAGNTYRVVKVRPVAPSTVNLVYELIVRNG